MRPTAPRTSHIIRSSHGSPSPKRDISKKPKGSGIVGDSSGSVGLPENPNPPHQNSSLEDSFSNSRTALKEYVATKDGRRRRNASTCAAYYRSGDTTEEDDGLGYSSASNEMHTDETDTKLVDVSYGNECGFSEVAGLPSATSSNVKFIQAKKPISRYLGEITQYSRKARYNIEGGNDGKVEMELRPRIKLVLPPRKPRESKDMGIAKVRIEESPRTSPKAKAKKRPRELDDGEETLVGAQPIRRSARAPKKRVPFQG
jgi:hypothetical protein